MICVDTGLKEIWLRREMEGEGKGEGERPQAVDLMGNGSIICWASTHRGDGGAEL